MSSGYLQYGNKMWYNFIYPIGLSIVDETQHKGSFMALLYYFCNILISGIS